jgi:hypothetical protein
MMEQFTTPTGPPADQKKDRSSLYKWLGAAAIIFVVAAMLSGGESNQTAPAATPRVTTTTTFKATSTTLSERDMEEQIQLLAITQVLDENEEELCRLVRELVLRDGMDLDFVVDVALSMFMEGFGDDLMARPQQMFRSRIRGCI